MESLPCRRDSIHPTVGSLFRRMKGELRRLKSLCRGQIRTEPSISCRFGVIVQLTYSHYALLIRATLSGDDFSVLQSIDSYHEKQERNYTTARQD